MTQLRSFLFLQGPHGPFFADLAAALRARGHRTVKINLNGGDRFFWRGADALSFQEPYAHWGGFIRGVMERYGVTDLIVYGDCRPHHKLAIRLARAQGIAVRVFEEGYLRPNWITLEDEGVNGFSRLSRDPDEIMRLAEDLPGGPPPPPAGRVTRMMGLMCLIYAAANAWGRRQFRHYRSHRINHPLVELMDWITRLVGYPRRQLSVWWTSRKVMADPRDKFLVLMQLNGDYQLRTHSYYEELQSFLLEALHSFATHAAPASVLVYKNHPLDTGNVPYRRILMAQARRLGVEDRVYFIDGGKLTALLRRSKGALTVNSTSGLAAMQEGVPLIALGDAIYNIKGLTFDGDLAEFWRQATPPSPALYGALKRYLMAHALLPGSFYTSRARKLAVAQATERLLGSRVTASGVRDEAVDRFPVAPQAPLAANDLVARYYRSQM